MRFLLSRKHVTLREIIFNGSILAGADGGTTLPFYGLAFPTAIGPDGRRSS